MKTQIQVHGGIERSSRKIHLVVMSCYFGEWYVLLTLPYLACQAKKYRRAPRGCPTKQKLIQNMQLPMIFPVIPSIFVNGFVIIIKGSCITMPRNATPGIKELATGCNHEHYLPRSECVGTPTASSCSKPENKNTIALAVRVPQPRPTRGEKTCLLMK